MGIKGNLSGLYSPKRDGVIAALVALGAFSLYAITLVPTVLDGDQGQFQYIAPALGIPYPSGFPLYLLIGFLWSHLPFANVALGMNLFSALCGALAVGFFWMALRSQKIHLLPALLATVTLVLVPALWKYSTWASEHALNNLLTVLLLLTLIRWEKTKSAHAQESVHGLLSVFFVFGLGLANHPSFLLFAPATAIFLLLGRVWQTPPRIMAPAVVVSILPLLLYLYFPLRGIALTDSPTVTRGWTAAMAHGLVSVFFEFTPAGLLRYFSASQFTGSMIQAWNWRDAMIDLGNAILAGLNPLLLVLAALGIVQFIRTRSRMGVWFAVTLLCIALVAPQFIYGAIGQNAGTGAYFEKFLQPVFILLVFLQALGMDWIFTTAQRIQKRPDTGHHSLTWTSQRMETRICSNLGESKKTLKILREFVSIRADSGLGSFASQIKFGFTESRWRVATIIAAFALVALSGLIWSDLAAKHSPLAIERSIEIQAKWDTIVLYPPETDAALVGHWGDLTPLWYYQTANQWRPDLVGLYPPQDALIDQLLADGRPVYIAGDLLGWAPKTLSKHILTPWGPLVRVSQKNIAPPSPLGASAPVTFKQERPLLRLLGSRVSASAIHGTLDIATYWQVLDALPLDSYLIYFTFSAPSLPLTTAYKSAGDALAVSWLSGQQLTKGQRALGTYQYKIPAGVPEGNYQVNLLLYSTDSSQNLQTVPEGATQLAIGTVRIDRNGGVVAGNHK